MRWRFPQKYCQVLCPKKNCISICLKLISFNFLVNYKMSKYISRSLKNLPFHYTNSHVKPYLIVIV